jgi:DNA-binding FadR family transcriptional regulator
MGGFVAVGETRRVLDLIERIRAEDQLGPGSRLPTERDLAERAGASRAAVRKALGMLEAEGRVVRQVGRGTFFSAQVPPPGDHAISPSEIMTARILVEPQLMPIAATVATVADFTEMDRCLAGGDSAEGQAEFELWDTALHRSLAVSTHNNVLVSLSEQLSLAREQPLWGGLKRRGFTPERMGAYRADHHAIVEALRDRDPDAAQQAMRTHLLRVKTHILGEH